MNEPFKCCGAGECKTFEHSCQNPANYPEPTASTTAPDDVLRCACGSEEWIGGGLIEILSGRIYCAKCGADEPH